MSLLSASDHSTVLAKGPMPQPCKTLGLLAAVGLLSACAGEPITATIADPPLPAFPNDSDLVEFYVSPTTTNRFMVDSRSIDVAPDRDIRLTLVIRSPSGARTVTREAIRCASADYRILAIGDDSGAWSPASESKWRQIENSSLNRHRAALASDYLCDGSTSIGSAAAALDALRNPGKSRRQVWSTP